LAVFPAGESITLEEVKDAYVYYKKFVTNFISEYSNNSKKGNDLKYKKNITNYTDVKII
tara:strand:- start:278 stop:454 length:177 start_codon:yes stop_codon:yes gene_type:complete